LTSHSLKELLPRLPEKDKNVTTIFHIALAVHISPDFQPIDQFHGTVVAKPQSLGQQADCGVRTGRQPADGQQQ
jgi:hypothetical protein